MKAWEKNIRKVEPYVPGEQPKNKNVIKLNTNECPYAPAPGVAKAMADFNSDILRLYPDPDITKLTNEIAAFYGISPKKVFVGVGSDDVLAIAFQTYFNSHKPIFFPDITYSFYDVWADLFGIKYETKPVDEKFEINPKDYYEENGGVIFANPNAPTAISMPLESVEDIIRHNQDVVVIVDEAYVDFGGESAISLTDKYENLVVVQTFSKSRSMAGSRIGFAIANELLIKAMADVKFSFNSYTLNSMAIEAGTASISDRKYFEDTVAKVVATRERAKENFKELGFTCTDSKTNFLFVSHEKFAAKDIFEYLKANNIYVRYFNKPRINNHLRVTIGTDEDMDKMFRVLGKLIQEN